MPEFAYRAAAADGRAERGRLKAPSRETALLQLQARGLTPIALSDAATDGSGRPALGIDTPRQASPGEARPRGLRIRRRAIGQDDIPALTSELATMLEAGLPLDRALRIIADMATHPEMADLLESLIAAVKAGKSFSQALAPHQALFGEFYLNLVRAGEASGKLADALHQLERHLERSRQLRDSLKAALTYPFILLLVAVISILLMLGFVVPQFESLFDDLGDGLPWSTRALVGASHFLTQHGLWLLLATVLGIAAAAKWSGTPGGRRWLDRRALALPWLGAALTAREIGQFSRTLGTLLGSGVPIVGALRTAADTIGNQQLREPIAGTAEALKRGERLADAFARLGIFSPLALNMVRLGEETGRLDRMLLKLADVQAHKLEVATKRMLTLVEPLLILLLGGVIAAIMAALLMGILSVNELAI